MNRPPVLTLEDVQTALWRVTPVTRPEEHLLGQQMYYHGKCDALRAAMKMIEGETEVTWKLEKKEKPRVEQAVLGIVPRFTYLTIFYEDGTVRYEDSEIEWVDDNGQEFIPEGWYMRVPGDPLVSWDYDVMEVPTPTMWMYLPLPRDVGDFE